MKPTYKRILLKLSGEAMAGEAKTGLDFDTVLKVCAAVKECADAGVQIGVIVVGTGLPMVCTEQKILQGYFEEAGKDGFAYAYQYPGMNKVLQAAGRVIRTASDQGVILLLDDRFWRREYRELFPREWSDVKRVSLSSLEQELQAFWSRFPEVQ